MKYLLQKNTLHSHFISYENDNAIVKRKNINIIPRHLARDGYYTHSKHKI